MFKLFGKKNLNKAGSPKFGSSVDNTFHKKVDEVKIENAVRTNAAEFYGMSYGYTLLGNPMNR